MSLPPALAVLPLLLGAASESEPESTAIGFFPFLSLESFEDELFLDLLLGLRLFLRLLLGLLLRLEELFFSLDLERLRRLLLLLLLGDFERRLLENNSAFNQ